MAFHHRKLLDESIPDIIVEFCLQNCDEPDKFNGTCPLACFNTCPPNSCKQFQIPPLPPPPPPPPLFDSKNPSKHQGGVSLALIVSLAVLATAFFIFTCYTIYKFYTVWRNSQRRRRRQLEQDGGSPDDDFLDEDAVDHPIWHIRTIGLQPSVINAITIVKYKSADGLVEGTDCAVCLSEFQEDETLRLLPKCSHAFHIPCIDTWLTSHTNCPMCRAGIVNNVAGPSALQEPSAHHSGRAEEASHVSGSEIETEGDGAARSQIGIEMNENVEGGDCKIDSDGLQPVRRSVSMDSLSASVISAAVANAFPRQCDKNSDDRLAKAKVGDVGNRSLLGLFESPSIASCVQTGSSSIKRSASCSAKVFLSRHSSRR